MRIKGREYIEESLGAGMVRVRLITKPDGYHVDVNRARLRAWVNGTGYIQDMLPELSADQREFLMSGSDPEEFERLFGKEDQ